MRKLLKDYVEKSEEKLKKWTRNCQDVLANKKELKDVLPESFYTQRSSIKSVAQIMGEYENELRAISKYYDEDSLAEMGTFVTPANVRHNPATVRMSVERNSLVEIDDEIRRIQAQAPKVRQELQSLEQDIGQYTKKIGRYEQMIQEMKISKKPK